MSSSATGCPRRTADRRPYIEDGSVEVGRANLTGAKYTLAVPAYTYQAGLKSFADIQRFAPQLHQRSTASSRATTAIAWC